MPVLLRHRRIVEDDQRFDLLVSGMGLIEDADCFLLGARWSCSGWPLSLSGVLGGFFWVDLHLPQHRAVVCNHSLGARHAAKKPSASSRSGTLGSDQKITFRRLGIGLTIFTSIHVYNRLGQGSSLPRWRRSLAGSLATRPGLLRRRAPSEQPPQPGRRRPAAAPRKSRTVRYFRMACFIVVTPFKIQAASEQILRPPIDAALLRTIVPVWHIVRNIATSF